MKIKAVVLSLALAGVLLTGCTSNEAPETNTTEENQADVVTTASLVADGEGVVNGLSKDGKWIVALLDDVTTDKEIVVEGDFHNKDDASQDLYRKLAPYTQDADHKVTGEFTLTAPKMIVKSPNFRIQNGTFVGDIYVEANGFNIKGAKVEGNIYFATEEYQASFTNDGGEVTGTTEVKAIESSQADVTTTASLVADGEGVVNGLSKDGEWIVCLLDDVTTDKEIVVEGDFYNKDDKSKDLYRKLAPYTQDADHKVTGEFTLTAPKMVVKSPNFRIQNGTFVGDIYVEANGFNIKGAKVEGNIYFATEEYQASFTNDGGEVTGATEVKAQ